MNQYVDPSRENWNVFKSLPRDTPIHMLNLLKFRDVADYPEGHANHGKGLSGAQAYAIYRKEFQRIAARLDGAMVWERPFECVVTGPADEWDDAFVMGYPDARAFFAMVKDEDYVINALPHRTAAVADSRLMRFRG